ncbi:O-methyltransferase [Jongsikchunia kroppenstedtii]|uniref:O-methyltransferase n=1 Tax=Jongsikchunia kroppenstedtii TaxID=1121721 RepID=UPI00037310C9|nr:O-methyltransferase [Jongsikchunia kroppenstedtii]
MSTPKSAEPRPIDPDWLAVDQYLVDTLLGADPALDHALAANADAELPPIDVSRAQGEMLGLLVRATGARRVLEVGTLGGFSTICLARGVGADGSVITCEYEPRHAEVARSNIDSADVGDRVEIRVGAALDTLAALAEENAGPFDFVFLDADKENNANYLELSMALTHPGSLIVVDNVIRRGAAANPDTDDERTLGTRAALEWLGSDERVDATAVQTVGTKGWDGFAMAVVR